MNDFMESKQKVVHQTVMEYLLESGADVKRNIADLIGRKDENNGETRDFKDY